MILHFQNSNRGRLNVNFDKHIYNTIPYKTFFCVDVSQIDFDRIREELDFNMFSYDDTDTTITPEADPEEGEALPF